MYHVVVPDLHFLCWHALNDTTLCVLVQDIPLKQQIFADLEKACRPDAILSSNTSTIDISLIGKKTRAADRIVGAHFFSPAHIMPLLEIVRTSETSKQVRSDGPCTHCTTRLL